MLGDGTGPEGATDFQLGNRNYTAPTSPPPILDWKVPACLGFSYLGRRIRPRAVAVEDPGIRQRFSSGPSRLARMQASWMSGPRGRAWWRARDPTASSIPRASETRGPRCPLRFGRKTQCLAPDGLPSTCSFRQPERGLDEVSSLARREAQRRNRVRAFLPRFPLPSLLRQRPGARSSVHNQKNGLFSAGSAPGEGVYATSESWDQRTGGCRHPPDAELAGWCPGGALRWMDGWNWKGPDRTTQMRPVFL